MKDTNILVFGDSITYGAFDYKSNGWVNRLRLALDDTEKSDFYTYNLGINSDATIDVLNRFENECAARYIENSNTIIIFAIGINDTVDQNGIDITTLKQFEINIIELIKKLNKLPIKYYF